MDPPKIIASMIWRRREETKEEEREASKEGERKRREGWYKHRAGEAAAELQRGRSSGRAAAGEA